MSRMKANTDQGLEYEFFRCSGCGEELVNTAQLQEVMSKTADIKTYNAKITQWGQSLGIRIPKELVVQHNIASNEEVKIIPDGRGFRIVPKLKR